MSLTIARKDSLDNTAGMQGAILFAPLEDIDVMPPEISGTVAAITFIGGKGFYTIDGTLEQGAFSETESPSGNGSTYFPKIIGFIPQDRQDVLAIIEQMSNRHFVVAATDNNGMMRIAGRPEDNQGMSVKVDRNITQNASGSNGNLVMFYAELPFRAPFYEADIVYNYADCPSLQTLILAATPETLYEDISFAGKLVAFIQSLSEADLLNLTSAQIREVIKDSSVADFVAGYGAMSGTNKIDHYYGIAANVMMQAPNNTTVATPISSTFPALGAITFDKVDPSNFNVTAILYFVNLSPVTLPFSVTAGQSVKITYTKLVAATPSQAGIIGRFTNITQTVNAH